MAKLDDKPNMGIVGRLKPPLDFYQWKGIWVVRVYPVHIHQPGTPEQKVTWTAMRIADAKWISLPVIDREAWKRLASGSGKTGRDLFISGYLIFAAGPGGIFTTVKIESVGWSARKATVWVKLSDSVLPEMDWGTNRSIKKDKRWQDVGECIRGRKFVRRMALNENWKNKLCAAAITPDKRYKSEFVLTEKEKTVFFTVNCGNVCGAVDSGRSGIYNFKVGETWIT